MLYTKDFTMRHYVRFSQIGPHLRLTCVTVSKTIPKDHLIVLCVFLMDKKAHATSSSIQVQVNCSRM